MSFSRQMQAAYDEIADEYAARYGADFPGLDDWRARFLGIVKEGKPLLEIGCGPGRDMAWLEAHGWPVVGVDLSAGMLARARAQVRGPLAQMDMRRLSFPANCFGGVWCLASLLHLPKADAPQALSEMWRVLTPGGALMLAIQEGEEEGWETNPYGRAVDRFFARYTQEEAEAMLIGAGFNVRERGRNESRVRVWLQFLASK